MLSCDLTLVTRVTDGLTYDQAVLSAGLANRLNRCAYAGVPLYLLQGRGIEFVDQLLTELGVPCRDVPPEQVRSLWSEGVDALLMIVPYFPDPRLIDKIRPGVTQFFSYFGTHLVTAIDTDRLSLVAVDEDVEQESSFEWGWVERLATTRAKPLGRTVSFLAVDRVPVDARRVAEVTAAKRDALAVDAEEEDDAGRWVQGPGMYAELVEVLSTWNQWPRTGKFALFQSMLSGSAFFYRREYAAALVAGSGTSGEPDRLLNSAGNKWRALGRHLRGHAAADTSPDLVWIRDLVTEIQDVEMRFAACSERQSDALCAGRT
jgi:hypothetical protein